MQEWLKVMDQTWVRLELLPKESLVLKNYLQPLTQLLLIKTRQKRILIMSTLRVKLSSETSGSGILLERTTLC